MIDPEALLAQIARYTKPFSATAIMSNRKLALKKRMETQEVVKARFKALEGAHVWSPSEWAETEFCEFDLVIHLVYRLSHSSGYFYIGKHASLNVATFLSDRHYYWGSGQNMRMAQRLLRDKKWNREVLYVSNYSSVCNRLELDTIKEHISNPLCLNDTKNSEELLDTLCRLRLKEV